MDRAQRFFSRSVRARHEELVTVNLEDISIPQVQTPSRPTHMQVSVGKEVSEVRSKYDLEEVFKKIDSTIDPVTFSYPRDVSLDLMELLYNKYRPLLATFNTGIPGRMTNPTGLPDFAAKLKSNKCNCEQCLQGTHCGRACFEAHIPYLAEDPNQSCQTSHAMDEMQWVAVSLDENTVVIHIPDLTVAEGGSSAMVQRRTFVRKAVRFFLYMSDESGRVFAFTASAELTTEICNEWGTLIQCCKQLLSYAGRRILNEDGQIPRHLLRSLTKVADLSQLLETAQRQQHQSIQSLREQARQSFHSHFHLQIDESYKGNIATEQELLQLARVGEEIEKGLTRKVDNLFQRASNIMSIDEAYKSRQNTTSMKRLSWITFIFLPLVFVASLYGMNVDIFKNNLPWTSYFYVAIPVFIVVIFCAICLKNIPDTWSSNLNRCFTTLKRLGVNRMRNPRHLDEENQNETPAAELLHGSWDSFVDAAQDGSLYLVDSLLGIGVNVESRNRQGWTAIQVAASRGHLKVVERLLSSGAAVNAEPSTGNDARTALQAAAEGGHMEVVKLLLSKGAEMNAKPVDRGGRTALQAAVESGHLEMVNLLLSKEAEVNAEPSTYVGRTALQAAVEGGHQEMVNLLLFKGAEVNAEPSTYAGRTALQAAAEGGRIEMVNLLLSKEAEVDADSSTYAGRTALQAAAGSGHLEATNLLLSKGAKVNAKPSIYSGLTALQAAAGAGHLEVVNLLLSRGAEVNAGPGHGGRTALQAAAEGGHREVVNLLLSKAAKVNAAPGNCGITALQAAAGGGHLNIATLLLSKGAEVNAESSTYAGRTALQAAAEGGHTRVVNLLLSKGAEVNAGPGHNGRTALQAAAGSGHLEVVNLLLSKGAEVNAAPSSGHGRTALQAAAEGGYLEVVERLLDSGANVMPRTRNGKTALSLAIDSNHHHIAETLRKRSAT